LELLDAVADDGGRVGLSELAGRIAPSPGRTADLGSAHAQPVVNGDL
jgi:hypothetical protein